MKKHRILIVDDNASLHEDFRKILSGNQDAAKSGLKAAEQALFGDQVVPGVVQPEYDLDFASQGEEAYNKVINAAKADNPYALLFMDIRMPPGWDGVTTVDKIWKLLPLTEVVFCTAYSDYSLEDVISKLGKSEHFLFLKKPFDTVEVQQMAIALTRKWRLEHEIKIYTENLERLVEQRTKELDIERAKSVHGAKLMALGEMAGGVAHEINNPLAIIHANANLLKDLMEEDFDKVMGLKITDKIITTTERIAKIIRGLRAFSRSGENDPFEQVTMSQIVEETLGISLEKFKVNDVKLTVENPVPFSTVECRQVQIVQVLLNLLNNSYDAIENLKEKWVKIEIKENADSLDLCLTDSGTGLPLQIRDKIYQPFFTTKEIGKGTGLGLSISKGIIEGHKGKIWVDEDCPNTRFIVRLPKHQGKVMSPVPEKKAG